MLTIFTNSYASRGNISLPPTTEWYRLRVKDNNQKLQDYMSSSVRHVRNDHPLVQILKHSGNYTQSPVELFDLAYSRDPYVSKSMKFTTDFNRGTLKGMRVYSTQDNLIYSESDYIRPYQAVDNWRSLTPLKCLWVDTPYVDMAIPSNILDTTPGFSAVSIDAPMMSLMYKGFKNDLKMKYGDGLVLGEDQFISMYVLPSILRSQADISCVSATIAVHEGRYTLQSRVNTNIFLPSYSSDFLKIATYSLERISDSRMKYLHMLQSIPSVYNETAQDALILPEFAPTTQVEWAMLISRLKVINFLFSVGGNNGRKANEGFINQLKVYVRKIQNARIPYTEMSDELAGYVDNSLVKINRM